MGRGAITAVASVMCLVATACIPVDDFGPLFWVDNQTDQLVYAASDSGSFNPFPVPARSVGQGDFIGAGTEITLVATDCMILGRVTLADDVTIGVSQSLEVTTAEPPSKPAPLLEQLEGLEIPGCEDSSSRSGD